MSDIKPNEQELKAADNCASSIGVFENTARAILRNGFARIIAACTRYEGKTAEEWARLQQQTAFVVREVNLRAEAAEAKVKELAAESLDYKAKWLDACHNHKVVSENRAAAIAEAVSKTVDECVAWLKNEGYFDTTNSEGEPRLRAAILALNTPAPAYPFAHPCKCWEYSKPIEFAESQSNWRRLLATHSTYVFACPDANYCEVCGAPRTKGS